MGGMFNYPVRFNQPSLRNIWPLNSEPLQRAIFVGGRAAGVVSLNDIFPRIHEVNKHILSLLSLAKLNVRPSIAPGIAILGVNVFFDQRPGPHKPRSTYALDYALKLHPHTVLDVGSGGGQHARTFQQNGADVLCVDYGTSVYARKSTVDGLTVIQTDFNTFDPQQKYDLVWASHVLEHQRNAGAFIERLVACCSDDGHICITIPDAHRKLLGGHVSMWSPGLLAYNIVLCGIDISRAVFVRGTHEFSIFFKPARINLPADLTYDRDDLEKLSRYLPQGWTEFKDPWKVLYGKSLKS
jgi:2-polyprenyl-3-methyl-5-hydroxy-6-metoxy-1,4-benzoquinol methylase